MQRLRPTTFFTVVAMTSVVASSSAFAQDEDPPDPVPMTIHCDGTFMTAVTVDGFQADWEDEATDSERIQQLIAGEYRYDWTGPVDASFRMWCRYDNDFVYFAVVARDNIVVGPEDGHDGDRMEFYFQLGDDEDDVAVAQVPIWPMNDLGTAEVTWVSGSGGPLDGAIGEVAPRPETGFFMEVGIPTAAFDGYRPGFAPIGFAAVHRDWDYDGRREHEVGVGTADVSHRDADDIGLLTFTGADDLLELIANRIGLEAGQEPDATAWGNVMDGPGDEYIALVDDEVVIGGRVGTEYTYMTLNVNSSDRQEPISLQTRDIDRDGDDEIILRYQRERTSIANDQTMTQELIAIYDFVGTEFRRVLHQEVANEIPGGGRLASDIEYRRDGIRIDAADGDLDETTWFDVDAGIEADYQPMPLDWVSDRVTWEVRGGVWTAEVED